MDNLGLTDQFIREIDEAQNIEAVTLALRKNIDLLGFERSSYQLLRSPQGLRPKFYITGYSTEWTRQYVEKNYVSDDMVSRHGTRVVRPFSWLEIGRLSDLTDDQQIVFNEASGCRAARCGGDDVPLRRAPARKILAEC